MTTLVEVNDAWNELHNAAFGRGVSPLVAPALASEVERAYNAWREYYQGLQSSFGLMDPLLPSVELFEEIASYRRTLELVRKAGHAPAHVLPRTPLETLGDVAETAAEWTLGIVAVAAGVVFAGGLLLALRGQR